MRAFLACALLATLATVAACTDNGVGRKCIVPNPDGGTGITQTLISSPALECPSRICIIQQPGSRATCTVRCQTNDDCSNAVAGKASEGLCDTGFLCAVATVAGPYRCQTICVCKGDLKCGINEDNDGGVITPASCGGTVSPTCN